MITVDCRGQLCPGPIIELAKAIATIEPGAELDLLSDDPAAHVDVAAWCRMQGHQLVSETSVDAVDGSVTAYRVRRGTSS